MQKFNLKLKTSTFYVLALIFDFCTLKFLLFNLTKPVHSQSLSLSLWPPLLEVMIQPGRTVTQAYQLTNNSEQTLQITPRIFPFKPQGENGQIKIKFQEPSEGPVFSFESGEKFNQPFVLRIGQSQKLTLRIRIPRSQPEEDLYYTLLFSSGPPEDRQGQSSTSSVAQIGGNILITVSKLGQPVLLGRILEFSAPKIIDSLSAVNFNVRLENWGQTFFKPFGQIKITGLLKQKDEIPLLEQNVLANSSRRLTLAPFKPHLPLGLFKALLEFTLNETGPKFSSEIVFWYLPYKVFGGVFVAGLGLILVKKFTGRKRRESRQQIKPLASTLTIVFFFFSFFNPKILLAQGKGVEVSARVGYLIESLTGWTSPFAEVFLSSLNFSYQGVADENGFFAFYDVPVLENTSELCLISQDVNQLASSPICLPSPPAKQNIQIQDVLLSPSLSLENNLVTRGQTAKASGMTVPNSSVDIYLFSEGRLPFWTKIIRFVKPVQATALPLYEIKSNADGYFEFSLPAAAPSENRLFAVSYLSNLGDLSNLSSFPSPKSNTLSFRVMGFWDAAKKFLSGK